MRSDMVMKRGEVKEKPCWLWKATLCKEMLGEVYQGMCDSQTE